MESFKFSYEWSSEEAIVSTDAISSSARVRVGSSVQQKFSHVCPGVSSSQMKRGLSRVVLGFVAGTQRQQIRHKGRFTVLVIIQAAAVTVRTSTASARLSFHGGLWHRRQRPVLLSPRYPPREESVRSSEWSHLPPAYEGWSIHASVFPARGVLPEQSAPMGCCYRGISHF